MQEAFDFLLKKLSFKKVKKDVLMENLTTFRIGGKCDILVEPENTEEVDFVIRTAERFDLPIFVMGNGSNLLVSDSGIRGITLKIGKGFSSFKKDDNILSLSAGLSLTKLSKLALDYQLSGLEFAYGLPACLGGAVFMNAGAFGSELCDVITEVEVLKNGKIISKKAEECGFSYRTSNLKDSIILGATIKLKDEKKDIIEELMSGFFAKRKNSQPLNCLSAGSVFKRPVGDYAPRLIEELGLKNFRVNGARVSDIHCGFIVNDGFATCDDVLKLIDIIKQKVLFNFGILLEEEIKIVGDFKECEML